MITSGGAGELKTDAGPSRDRLIAPPEISLPLPLAMPSPEIPADVVKMAVSHARASIWWLSWFDGLAGIIFGLMLLTTPDVTTIALVSLLGFLLARHGMLALVRVFADQSVPWIWSLIIGVAGILTGLFVVRLLLAAVLILPTAAVAVLGVQGLITGGLEIIIGVIGAGLASFILGAVYLLVRVFLLGSVVAAALATPAAFGVLSSFWAWR
jgi:Short repeat of unknown function (DUF308)